MRHFLLAWASQWANLMRQVLLLTAVLTACGTRESLSGTRESEAVDAEAMRVFASFTQASWKAARNPTFGTVGHLEALTSATMPELPTRRESVLKLLERNPTLFHLSEGADHFLVEREEEDDLKMTHVRLRQVVRGVPVYHGEVVAHLGPEGDLRTLDAHVSSEADKVSTTPQWTSEAALALAKGYVEREMGEFVWRRPPEASLVIHHDERGAARLAYHVTMPVTGTDRVATFEVFVDAQNGAVFDAWDGLTALKGSGVGCQGKVRALEISQTNTGYALLDVSRTPNGIVTLDAQNRSTLPGQVVVSTTPTSWDGTGPAAGSAVDAHAFLGTIYDYFKSKHQRLGIDGKDGALVASVHFQTGYANAFWDGNQMVFGDGDGVKLLPTAGSLAVVAHEMTHGVTEVTAGLEYRNQSGALNESISDIFASFIKHHTNANASTDWQWADDASVSGVAVRNLAYPSKGGQIPQPAHMSKYLATTQDSGGVHINSGIPNNAAYLMTMGGINEVSKVKVAYGLGFEKAEKLWYRALTKYFVATTNFAGAAQHTLTAASDLGFTDNERSIVECAWVATGVLPGPCKAIVDPRSSEISPPAVEPQRSDSPTVGGGDGPTRPTMGVPTAGGDGAQAEQSRGAMVSGRRLRAEENGSCAMAAAGHGVLAGRGGFPGWLLGMGALAFVRRVRGRASSFPRRSSSPRARQPPSPQAPEPLSPPAD